MDRMRIFVQDSQELLDSQRGSFEAAARALWAQARALSTDKQRMLLAQQAAGQFAYEFPELPQGRSGISWEVFERSSGEGFGSRYSHHDPDPVGWIRLYLRVSKGDVSLLKYRSNLAEQPPEGFLAGGEIVREMLADEERDRPNAIGEWHAAVLRHTASLHRMLAQCLTVTSAGHACELWREMDEEAKRQEQRLEKVRRRMEARGYPARSAVQ